MKKWIFASIASILFMCAFNTVWAENGDLREAKKVIENWFAAMKSDDISQAATFLSPQFVSIHTDGIVRNKAQEIELMKKLRMKDYNLTDFKFSQSGQAIVVTYKDKGIEQIDNKPIAPHFAGRLAVLQKKDGKWFILAYANLDKIG